MFVGQEKEYKIYPEEGDLIIFPSVMNRVSVSQTDDERIVIVGNIR